MPGYVLGAAATACEPRTRAASAFGRQPPVRRRRWRRASPGAGRGQGQHRPPNTGPSGPAGAKLGVGPPGPVPGDERRWPIFHPFAPSPPPMAAQLGLVATTGHHHHPPLPIKTKTKKRKRKNGLINKHAPRHSALMNSACLYVCLFMFLPPTWWWWWW
jgi:hypothetical protein